MHLNAKLRVLLSWVIVHLLVENLNFIKLEISNFFFFAIKFQRENDMLVIMISR